MQKSVLLMVWLKCKQCTEFKLSKMTISVNEFCDEKTCCKSVYNRGADFPARILICVLPGEKPWRQVFL